MGVVGAVGAWLLYLLYEVWLYDPALLLWLVGAWVCTTSLPLIDEVCGPIIGPDTFTLWVL